MELYECTKCNTKTEKQYFSKITSLINKTGTCKECKNKTDREYRKKNKEKLRLYFQVLDKTPKRKIKSKLYQEKKRHGINATEYVKDKKCERCGMNNEEHKIKYNERLHVHHNENTGRKNIRLGLKPIHKDLKVLCRSCHVTIDNANKDYTGRGFKIWETRRKNQAVKNEV